MTNKEMIMTELQLTGRMDLLNNFLENKLLTYAEWKKRGLQVQKGQKAVFKTQIWVKVKKKNKKGEEESRFIRKNASFFSPEQVK